MKGDGVERVWRRKVHSRSWGELRCECSALFKRKEERGVGLKTKEISLSFIQVSWERQGDNSCEGLKIVNAALLGKIALKLQKNSLNSISTRGAIVISEKCSGNKRNYLWCRRSGAKNHGPTSYNFVCFLFRTAVRCQKAWVFGRRFHKEASYSFRLENTSAILLVFEGKRHFLHVSTVGGCIGITGRGILKMQYKYYSQWNPVPSTAPSRFIDLTRWSNYWLSPSSNRCTQGFSSFP